MGFDLDSVCLAAMEAAEGLSQEGAWAQLCGQLATVRHPSERRWKGVDWSRCAAPSHALWAGLALLVQGELVDERRDWGQLKRQPWMKAWGLLEDLFHGDRATVGEYGWVAGLPQELQLLVIDALIEGGRSDPLGNWLASVTGAVWVGVYRLKLPVERMYERLWRICADSFEADGYGTGGESLDLLDLARMAPDESTAAAWRLRHALLLRATRWYEAGPAAVSAQRARGTRAGEQGPAGPAEQVRAALAVAEAAGVDVAFVIADCEAIVWPPARPLWPPKV